MLYPFSYEIVIENMDKKVRNFFINTVFDLLALVGGVAFEKIIGI
jgi:hypothetical protein